MIPRWLLIFLMLSAISLSSEGSELETETPELSSLFNPADAEHLLLVGFEDQSIGRPSIITSASSYRRRGSYQSSTWSKRISDQIAEDYHLQKLAEWPMTEVGVHCVVYRVPSLDSVPEKIQEMDGDKRISVVQKMHLFKTRSYGQNDPYFKLQSNIKLMKIDEVHAKTTGQNVTIGMIDTGVDSTHPDLAGQITRNENFAAEVSPSFASDKHGTAVAGIMVAKKNNGTGIIGVAPDAKLVALKACWPDSQDSITSVCNSYTLALAVNTAIKAGVKILNMSLTGPHDTLLEILLNKAIKKGIIVVAADTGLNKEDENFPASMKNVISVQAIGQTKDEDPVENQPVTAPGDKILTTLPHGTYDFISGSSMAAAEVSGIVALMLELKPDLGVEEIKSVLHQSALPEKLGIFSGINANHAVAALCEATNCKREGLSFAWRGF
jgi:hypothetical protein